MHSITGRPKDPVRIVDLNGINSGYCVGTQTPEGCIVLPRRLRTYLRSSCFNGCRKNVLALQGLQLPSLFGCPINCPRQAPGGYIYSLLHVSL